MTGFAITIKKHRHTGASKSEIVEVEVDTTRCHSTYRAMQLRRALKANYSVSTKKRPPKYNGVVFKISLLGKHY